MRSEIYCSTIIHTDQGTEFVTEDNYKFIQSIGFKPSVSNRGKPIDNSFQERFYGTFKEMLDYQFLKFAQPQDAINYLELKLKEYVCCYPKRTKKGVLTPNEILKLSFND